MKHLKQDALTQESINARNIVLLRENFPGVIEENIDGSFTINANKLQMLIDPKNATVEENGYELNWVGKKEAYHTAFSKNTKILKPLKDDSKDFDNTGNILIKGDNLDALKILKNNYFEAIKMIYIDPPYNTRSDNFVYRDNFTKSLEETMEELGYDAENIDYIKNIQGARTHSGWLSFMYPRLLLGRDLLKDDGVIFISIDDNEQANLKILCDEVFGENNFVGQITIQSNPRGSQSSNFFATVDEYLLCYAKNSNHLEIRGYIKKDDDGDYNLIDEDLKKYRLLGLRQRGGAWKREDRPKMYYPIYINPNNGQVSLSESDIYSKESLPKRPSGEESRWTWGIETFEKDKYKLIGKKVKRDGDNDFWDIFRKDYLENENGEIKATKPKTIWDDTEINYQNAKGDLKSLFNNSEIFDFPKPVYMLRKIISMFKMSNENDLILDFFAGSGTTAHAVMDLNAQDGGNRKFISVQWAEETPEKSEARKAGYETIFNITCERIKRAGEKIIKDDTTKQDLDIGFRVFEVVEDEKQSIYKKSLEETTQANLDLFTRPQVEDIDTVLYNLLVAESLLLSTKIECLKENAVYIAKNVVFIVGDITLDEVSKLLEEHKKVEYITIYSPLVNDNKFTMEFNGELARLGFSNDKLRFRG